MGFLCSSHFYFLVLNKETIITDNNSEVIERKLRKYTFINLTYDKFIKFRYCSLI